MLFKETIAVYTDTDSYWLLKQLVYIVNPGL
jgi:hypothetical protein